MKLWEALKIYEETGRRIRPAGNKHLFDNAVNWFEAGWDTKKGKRTLFGEWQVEPASVTVTKDKLAHAIEAANNIAHIDKTTWFEYLFTELGLGDT